MVGTTGGIVELLWVWFGDGLTVLLPSGLIVGIGKDVALVKNDRLLTLLWGVGNVIGVGVRKEGDAVVFKYGAEEEFPVDTGDESPVEDGDAWPEFE